MASTDSSGEDGVRVILSAPQLAAVLEQGNIGEAPTLSNRLWGGLRTIDGLLEPTGAGVLCVAPEPTMASKAGCLVFGANGVDNTATGLRQAWTGRDTQSLTQRGTSKLAESVGADPKTAANIGIAMDIAVPLALSAIVGAVRVAAIRAGRMNLIEHEAAAGSHLGGHTILKHVGRTEQELKARLLAERAVPVASTFKDLQSAETLISKVLSTNASSIKTWSKVANTKPLRLEMTFASSVGSGVVRATGNLTSLNKVRVILKLETYNGMPYYVLTAFPVL